MDDVQTITQIISSVGFPIVACGALFWMINSTMKELKDAIENLTKSIDIGNRQREEQLNG